jgi:hypothetical protein
MATGSLALLSNTTGTYNMANRSNAMVKNTTGSSNVAEGLNAVRLNTTGKPTRRSVKLRSKQHWRRQHCLGLCRRFQLHHGE